MYLRFLFIFSSSFFLLSVRWLVQFVFLLRSIYVIQVIPSWVKVSPHTKYRLYMQNRSFSHDSWYFTCAFFHHLPIVTHLSSCVLVCGWKYFIHIFLTFQHCARCFHFHLLILDMPWVFFSWRSQFVWHYRLPERSLTHRHIFFGIRRVFVCHNVNRIV